jgi:signal transduction histidine kinase/CheY-like chemotaxis protein
MNNRGSWYRNAHWFRKPQEGRQSRPGELASVNPDQPPNSADLESAHTAQLNNEKLWKEQQEELLRVKEELQERTRLLEQQRNKIRQTNLELSIAQNEIREKERFLEIARSSKSEFFATVSHEFRTPLNSIIVLSQLIAENKTENLNEKQIEFAQTIYNSGNLLLDLISEILEVIRIESGKIDLRPESTSLADLTGQLKQMFLPQAEQKGIKFRIEMQEGLPEYFYTDSRHLNNILRKLVSNAVKFTDKGEIVISLLRPGPEFGLSTINFPPEQVLLFSVKDTGIGIPEDKQELIFEAFQQAGSYLTSKYGGTGLGLTIARSLAGLLGGEIKIHSMPGKGSEFILALPECYIESFSATPAARKSSPWPGISSLTHTSAISPLCKLSGMPGHSTDDDRDSIRSGDKSLLIIDDDPLFANLLYDLAKEHGLKCLIAPTGECGLHYMHVYNPSAVILDICLPGINGWQVMEHLKKNPRINHTPVYFVSGAESTTEVSQMGALGFLSKPVNLETVRKAFQQIDEAIASAGIQKETADKTIEHISSGEPSAAEEIACDCTSEPPGTK